VNILQICNKFPYPLKDGGVIAVFTMFKGYYLLQHNVTVAAINTSKHYTNILEIPDSVASMAEFHAVPLQTNVTPWGALYNLFFSSMPYTATRFLHKKFEKELITILQTQSFDVIQIEGLYMCGYIPIIRKYSKAIISYRSHNIEYKIWERLLAETHFVPKKWYISNLVSRIKKLEQKTIDTYDVLVPITQFDADIYSDMGNTKPVFVAPTGVFTESLNPVESHEKTISLFHIGGLDWVPNQQGILWFIEKCWPHIYAQFPWLRFTIAGRNASPQFIKKMKVPGVAFVGEVEDSRQFMQENTIMIVPLLAGSGMRIKIIEGLALGKAIVSTSIGAEGIHAVHNESICIADSVQEFIDAVVLLIKKYELRCAIEKNAVTFVSSNFDNTTIISKLIEFYKKHGSVD